MANLWSPELGKISNLDMTNSTSWQPSDIMNADSGNEADSSLSPKRQRGRIPQSAWSRILQRYRAGATLSAIAREFDCTPSAISYIVRKAEATTGDVVVPDEAGPAPEPQPEAPPMPPPTPTAVPRPASIITTLSLPDRGSSQPRTTTLSLAPAPVMPPPAQPTVPPPVMATSPLPTPPPAPRPPATDTPRPAAESGTAAKAAPVQPPPVDAIEARLRETARGCLVAYRSWRQTPGETSVQTLNDAVHELRKALARVEIDLSASRREEPSMRPIPVPAHRAARQQQRS